MNAARKKSNQLLFTFQKIQTRFKVTNFSAYNPNLIGMNESTIKVEMN